MKQNMTGAPAQKSSFHSRAATVTGVMRPPLTTAGQYDHVAAAEYVFAGVRSAGPRVPPRQ